MGSTFKDKLGPMVPGAHLVPYADCYRCPLGSRTRAAASPAPSSRASSSRSPTAGAVAAIIVEPMQGTAGNVIPPNEFLPAVRSIARRARRAAHRRRDDHRLRPHRARTGASTTPASSPTSSRSARPSAAASRCRALAHDRRDREGEALVEPVGLVVELRRQPARPRPPAPPRCASSTRRTSSRTRAASARRCSRSSRPSSTLPVRRRGPRRGLFLRVELVRDKKTKAELPRKVTERIFHECVRRGLLTMSYAAQLPHPAGADDRRGDRDERPRDPPRGLRPRRAPRAGGAGSAASAAAPRLHLIHVRDSRPMCARSRGHAAC